MFRRLADPFREFGLFAGSLYVIDRILVRCFSGARLFFYELMVQPLSHSPLLPAAFSGSVKVREIKRGDADLSRMPVGPETIEYRFSQGAVCLGAYRDAKFLGYMWCCFRSYDEDEVRCTYALAPAEDAVFDFDFYIFPEHRLGTGFGGLWDGANEFLLERGIRRTFSRLTRFNLASRTAHARLGATRIGRALFFRAWRWELAVATVPPFFGVSLHPSQRVRLRLRVNPDETLG